MALARVAVVGATSPPNFQKRRQPSQVIAATAWDQQSVSSRKICLEAGPTLLG